jgi:DNA mismatch repair protein MutL
VRAFLAGPEEVSATARSTFLFVGGRFVRDRSLLHALALGYGPLLEKGRYPLAALFLDIPGREVDVNVHPQKLEVRFARAQEVYAAVRHVVGAAIARAPWLRAGDTLRTFTEPPYFTGGGSLPFAPPGPPRFARQSRAALAQEALPLRAQDAADLESSEGPGAAPQFFGALNYVGQIHRTYLVCEAADALVLIDQHAAHERVVYSRLKAAHDKRQIPRQRLLFPIPIEVGEAAAAAAGASDLLEALGFEVAPHGPGVVMLHALPEPLKDADPKPLLREVLAELAEGTPLSSGDLERVDHLLATVACHSVIRAGDPIARPAALALLAQLDEVDLRSHCPHGRPVMLRMPRGEIERRFGRG